MTINRLLKLGTTLLLVVLFSTTYAAKKPKYIFYFIGDGFGLNQSKAAENYLTATSDLKETVRLDLNQLPVQGFYTTHSSDKDITDSAAAGTALATGEKTSNGTISMAPNKRDKFKSIAYKFRDSGKKVGIISSVSIDHATPATFYANNISRGNYYEISQDLSKSGFNYFAGGDIKNPLGKDDKQKSSIEMAKENGYTYINTKDKFAALKSGDDKVIAVSNKIVGGAAMQFGIDSKEGDLTLAAFAKKGIELLDNKNGFFMMVEGGKIDWACHANDAATAIGEVVQFNNAVKVALDFYKKHPNETLIVVCGDHETGGMGLGFSGSSSNFKLLENQKVSYEEFTAKVDTYKREENPTFDGALDMIKECYGLGDESKGLALTEYEISRLKDAFEQSMIPNSTRTKKSGYYQLYGSYDPLTLTTSHIMGQKCGIGWTTYSHTSSPIIIRSVGIGSDSFAGYYDNVDVPKKLLSLMGLK